MLDAHDKAALPVAFLTAEVIDGYREIVVQLVERVAITFFETRRAELGNVLCDRLLQSASALRPRDPQDSRHGPASASVFLARDVRQAIVNHVSVSGHDTSAYWFLHDAAGAVENSLMGRWKYMTPEVRLGSLRNACEHLYDCCNDIGEHGLAVACRLVSRLLESRSDVSVIRAALEQLPACSEDVANVSHGLPELDRAARDRHGRYEA